MSALKYLKLLYEATDESICCFEEMTPLGEFQEPKASAEVEKLSFVTLVNGGDLAEGGDPVFARVTVTVTAEGSWKYLAESGYYDFSFQTEGSLQTPKNLGKALSFIEGLELNYEYRPFETPTALEAELAAAFGGYLNRLHRFESRSGKERAEPIIYGEKAIKELNHVEVPTMTTEELLAELDANDVLAQILRAGPSMS